MKKRLILVLCALLFIGNSVMARPHHHTKRMHRPHHVHFRPYHYHLNPYYHRFGCPARRGFRCTCFRYGGVYIDLRLPIMF